MAERAGEKDCLEVMVEVRILPVGYSFAHCFPVPRNAQIMYKKGRKSLVWLLRDLMKEVKGAATALVRTACQGSAKPEHTGQGKPLSFSCERRSYSISRLTLLEV